MFTHIEGLERIDHRSAPLLDRHWIDFVAQHADSTFSTTRALARIVAIRPETADMTTFVLRPNRRFGGFVPGQSVPIRVVIGGVVHERCYSPTSDPAEPTVAITVKRHPSGTVSRWFGDVAAVGDVVELGRATGAFVLPTPLSSPLLFIAGGSGITAVGSLIRAALRVDAAADAVLLYYARRQADFAFARLLRDLAVRHPRFRVHFLAQVGEDGHAPAGRFSPAHLAAWAPDYADRDTFLCGPSGLQQAVGRQWDAAGIAHRLRREAFAPIPDDVRTDGGRASVHFRRSVRTVESGLPTLLAIAEAAGLRPPTGCRMGICRTCVCTKVAGTVRDRATGAIDAAAGSRVRLCVSEPIGPVTLDL